MKAPQKLAPDPRPQAPTLGEGPPPLPQGPRRVNGWRTSPGGGNRTVSRTFLVSQLGHIDKSRFVPRGYRPSSMRRRKPNARRQ